MVTPRLEMSGIHKAFSGVNVLTDVSFSIDSGEVVALLGANGAGKSTLMKILCGLYTKDRGAISIDGKPVEIALPIDAIRAGIRLIPQEISVMPDMTTAENILIGDLPRRRRLGITTVDRRQLRKRAAALLSRLGLENVDPDRRLGSLSLPEQRVVEIARALAGNARVLVMDEPTAALSEAEAEILYSVIETLKREGVSVVFISHYLDEVFRITDRIVVLRDGRVSGVFRTALTTHQETLEAMLGNQVDDLYPEKTAKPADGAVLLHVAGLQFEDWLSDVSLDVRGGEIVGVFGLLGSGVEKLGRAIFGAEPNAVAEAIEIAGKPLARRDPARSVSCGVGFVAAERKTEGVIGILTVRDNTTAPYLHRFVRGLQVDTALETRQTRHWIDALGIRTTGPEQEVRLLSGGNQQKVCLARWLIGDARVLILEEPTRGVDVGARKEIYGEIRRLADKGIAVLVVSSDGEEVAGIADRSLVLKRGRIVAQMPGSASAHELMDAGGSAALA
jgi:ribose transport system ATP-binding protein